ncbi:hypothetical protein ES711_10460 [Gelidibacter salicanalis]|uniref:Uncharacterized protein n=1 Tax=Gelidibacter salicanalis TaxID=291193 RepID=A0A5C7AMQ4_9FLAO|nr:hypothetical protein [Gelidibacter salicanalis]TXE07845.1 hypothetical protein ES711_10460 [Gelidibacter salicanalis]
MNHNYLKNLLDRSSQTQSIVEPRLKSRFEGSGGLSSEAGLINTLGKEDVSIQESSPNVAIPTEAKQIKEKFWTNNSEGKTTNNSQENQTNFLKTTEDHFFSLEPKNEENRKESMESMQSKHQDIRTKSSETPNQNADNILVSKTYGLLNKPKKTTSINENSVNVNHDGITDNKTDATPVQRSIKISIGRIEIKAVNATHKAPTNPKPKPNLKLSLEDYINKRK